MLEQEGGKFQTLHGQENVRGEWREIMCKTSWKWASMLPLWLGPSFYCNTIVYIFFSNEDTYKLLDKFLIINNYRTKYIINSEIFHFYIYFVSNIRNNNVLYKNECEVICNKNLNYDYLEWQYKCNFFPFSITHQTKPFFVLNTLARVRLTKGFKITTYKKWICHKPCTTCIDCKFFLFLSFFPL